MAFTPVAFNEPFGKDLTAQRQYLHGLMVFTATAYVAGGILPAWGNILDQSGQKVQLATININPDTVWIQSISGSGWVYSYNKATGKIQIFTTQTTPSATAPPFSELVAGALPATVLSDIVEMELEWVRQ